MPSPTVVIVRVRECAVCGLTVSLHDTQEFDDNLGGGANQDLSLAAPFGVDDVVLKWVKLVKIEPSQEQTDKAIVLDEYLLDL